MGNMRCNTSYDTVGLDGEYEMSLVMTFHVMLSYTLACELPYLVAKGNLVLGEKVWL